MLGYTEDRALPPRRGQQVPGRGTMICSPTAIRGAVPRRPAAGDGFRP